MIMSFKQIHDEVTRLVNAITQGGGGGGGSTVSVVSKRTTGENIADITVNGVTTQLYSPDDAMEISFDPSIEGVYSGTNIQDVVDEITSDISSLNDTISKTGTVERLVETNSTTAQTYSGDLSKFKSIYVWSSYGGGGTIIDSHNIPIDIFTSNMYVSVYDASNKIGELSNISANGFTYKSMTTDTNFRTKVYGVY